MQIKASIFVSCTSHDLKSCREAAANLLRVHKIWPEVQEEFGPDYATLVEYLTRAVGGCDAVLCLVGKVFGAAPASNGAGLRSYTQIEYDVARRLGKPVFVFLTTDTFPYQPHPTDGPPEVASQLSHREILQQNHKCEWFASLQELEKKVALLIPQVLELGGAGRMYFLHPPPAPAYFAGRRTELEQLNAALDLSSPAVIAVVGMGGQGKTTLVRQAITERDRFPFAAGFWCSASRGGFGFDQFLDELLSYLLGQDYDKRQFAERRARSNQVLRLLQQRPILLVIDGIEHWLQGSLAECSASGSDDDLEPRRGSVPELDEFLTAVTGLTNGSHVLLTTRALPAALEHTACTVVPVREPGRHLGLEGLDEDAALALLRRSGVTGSDAELRLCAQAYGRHPLALEVLAGLLVNSEGGRINAVPAIDLLDPKQRLFQLFERTRTRLPGRDLSERLLQIASHCLEDPSTRTLHAAWRGTQGGWWRRLGLPWPAAARPNDAVPDSLQASILALAKWNLLDWDGVSKTVHVHPLIKEYYASLTPDALRLHHVLADLYQRQPVPTDARTLHDAKTALLAIEHALRAQDGDRAASLCFVQLTPRFALVPWFAAWGHHAHGVDLLRRTVEFAPPRWHAELWNARGALLSELGRLTDAMVDLDKAVVCAERRSFPRNAGRRVLLGGILINRGNVRRQRHELRAAIGDYDRALGIFDRVARRDASARETLADLYSNRGNAFRELGESSRALADYDTAKAIYEQRITEGQVDLAAALATVGLNRGVALADCWEHKSAVVELEGAALALDRQVVAGRGELAPLLAQAHVMWGITLNEAGRCPQAVEQLDRAVNELRRFVDGGRHDLEEWLARAWFDRAQTHVDLQQWTEARQDCDQSIETLTRLVNAGRGDLAEDLAHVWMIRAEAHLGQGDLQAARLDAEMGRQGLLPLLAAERIVARNVYIRKLSAHVLARLRNRADDDPVGNDPACELLRELLRELLDFAEREAAHPNVPEAVRAELHGSLGRLRAKLPRESFAEACSRLDYLTDHFRQR